MEDLQPINQFTSRPVNRRAVGGLLVSALAVGLWATAGLNAAEKKPAEDPRTVPVLVAAMAGEIPYHRLQAAKALGAKGTDALPAVLKALRDRDWKVRRGATDALAAMGADANSAVPQLAAALKDRDAWVRAGAAAALGKMGPLPADAAKALAKACTDPRPSRSCGSPTVGGACGGTRWASSGGTARTTSPRSPR